MKNLRTPLAILVVGIMATSCQKSSSDLEFNQQNIENQAPAIQLPAGVTATAWQTASNWNKVELPQYAAFNASIATDISNETAEKGIVRVFKTGSDATAAVSLPFEETVDGRKYYWYYQVTAGNVMIAVDAQGDNLSNPASKSQFKFVVLNKEAVSALEAEGKSKSDIMNLPYESLNGSN